MAIIQTLAELMVIINNICKTYSSNLWDIYKFNRILIFDILEHILFSLVVIVSEHRETGPTIMDRAIKKQLKFRCHGI